MAKGNEIDRPSGRQRMAHQRRIGDRSATYTKQRRSHDAEWEMAENLNEIAHDDRDAFNTEFGTKMNTRYSGPMKAMKGGRKKKMKAIAYPDDTKKHHKR